jgi:beta-mannosidase
LVWQLNDCWPVTSWAIVDFYLRPKVAYWVVKRESASQTVGLQRITEGIIEAWAVNLTSLPKTVDLILKIWDVRDGKESMHKVACQGFILEANQSTELMVLKIPEALQSPSIAVAAYVLESESKTLIARHVNFHETLKEVPFQHPKELSCRVHNDIDSTWVELGAEVPVKGVLVEIIGDAADNVSFEDNGVDLVPGESLRLNIGGMQKGDHVSLAIRWLGGSRLFD